jgi:hypothetical protein
MNEILIEVKDRVLRIEIARPEKKNALTQAMYGAMADALVAADRDSAVRAVLIHGARDCFTAGNDLKDFLERPPHSGETPVFRFLSALPTLAKPLVAAVNGAAVGIGTTMLLHCDLVYAAPGARFQLPFVSLGLVPRRDRASCCRTSRDTSAPPSCCCLRGPSMQRRPLPPDSSPRSSRKASFSSARARRRSRLPRCRPLRYARRNR